MVLSKDPPKLMLILESQSRFLRIPPSRKSQVYLDDQYESCKQVKEIALDLRAQAARGYPERWMERRLLARTSWLHSQREAMDEGQRDRQWDSELLLDRHRKDFPSDLVLCIKPTSPLPVVQISIFMTRQARSYG